MKTLSAILFSLAMPGWICRAAEAGPGDFVRDIQPIFRSKCYKCHGPEMQKGGYRLDVKSVALTGGDAHAPNIIPGKSGSSPLFTFVSGLDREMIMPAKGPPLSPDEVELIRAWIDGGAEWPENASATVEDPLNWWSLRPLTRPPVPDEGTAHPVDAFVQNRLAMKGLHPSPPASRLTLIRRVTYDLTGLPPSPEEVQDFLEDQSPNAWPAVIDRLLASPRYGERWARHWLDVVHYGDTHGYDKDQPRPHAWPYRDYVIRSLNTDKVYERFVQEQIAGDILFPGTADGVTALGFLSAGPWDLIGHMELPESKTDGKIARVLDRDDMVANTMTSFNALTVHCARCHSHKFDPVKQEDYYSLQAVFSALDRADKTFDADPDTARRRAELTRQRDDLERRFGDAARLPENRRWAVRFRLLEILRKGPGAPDEVEFGYHSQIAGKPDVTKWVQVDLGSPQALSGIRLIPAHDDYAGIGAGFGFPVQYKVQVSNDIDFKTEVTTLYSSSGSDLKNPGQDPVTIEPSGQVARYIRVTAEKLALRENDYIMALAELQALDDAGRNLALGAEVMAEDSIEAPARWQKQNLTDGIFRNRDWLSSAAEIKALEQEMASGSAPAPDNSTAAAFFKVMHVLAGVRAELAALPPLQTVYAGTVHHGSGNFTGTGAEGGKPRPIHVLRRGDVRQEGAEVLPAPLPISRELPENFAISPDDGEGARRAALARWLTDRRHPLTWRVIVNRVWQYHFGKGLCATSNDFGRMGELPSHPELLDWLAVEFRDNGQSLKALHRLILTSGTYQQSSAGNPAAEDIDSGNSLLWRMNRRKLEAEAVRDTILHAAGKLDLTMGGPGYQDFVIEKPEHSPHYQYHLHDPEDPATHRRSIYRFIVRSQTQPLMSVLDCADPSLSVDQRNETLNALQALALRNHPLTVSMARHFARRVEAMAPDMDSQIAAAFRIALSRPPTPDESASLADFAARHGMVNVCRIILNLNEFAFVD